MSTRNSWVSWPAQPARFLVFEAGRGDFPRRGGFSRVCSLRLLCFTGSFGPPRKGPEPPKAGLERRLPLLITERLWSEKFMVLIECRMRLSDGSFGGGAVALAPGLSHSTPRSKAMKGSRWLPRPATSAALAASQQRPYTPLRHMKNRPDRKRYKNE